jgi:hypothetical protein
MSPQRSCTPDADAPVAATYGWAAPRPVVPVVRPSAALVISAQSSESRRSGSPAAAAAWAQQRSASPMVPPPAATPEHAAVVTPTAPAASGGVFLDTESDTVMIDVRGGSAATSQDLPPVAVTADADPTVVASAYAERHRLTVRQHDRLLTVVRATHRKYFAPTML